ncbi:MAG: DMT family transporter, partial [Pseudomonadales bacterium]
MSMTQENTMGPLQWLMLITLSLLWGGSFFFMKVAVLEVPTFTIVFVRVAIAALMLLIYLKACGTALPRQGSLWALFFAVGLFNNLLPFSLLVWGMSEIASGLAAILNATTPLFTIAVAHFATADEKISLRKLAAILLGVAGVAVLIGPAALDSGGPLWAIGACLGAALSYAIASMLGRQFAVRGVTPSVGAFGQVTASSVLLIPLVLAFEQPFALSWPSTQVVLSLLALGALSTA